MAAEDRARVDDVIDARVAHDALARGVVAVQGLHEVREAARLGEGAREVLPAERASGGVLEHDCVARQDSRDDRVDRREERVVPRGQVEHHAERILRDAPVEPVLVREDQVGQGRLGDRDHVPGPQRHPGDFSARLGERLPHHPGDVGRDGLDAGFHGLDGALAQGRTLADAGRAEGARGGLGAVERGVHDRVVGEGEGAGGVAGEGVVEDERRHGARKIARGRSPGGDPLLSPPAALLRVSWSRSSRAIEELFSMRLSIGGLVVLGLIVETAGCSSSSGAPAPIADAGIDAADVAVIVDSSPEADVQEAAASYPAPHAAPPQVINAGGPVLTAPKLVTVTFASDPLGSSLNEFAMKLGAAKAYWSGATAEYGVGPIASVVSYVATDSLPVMLDDTDISATRHARAAVGGLIAGLAGSGAVYVSGGAEHQGPAGGGPVAVIARLG